MAANRWGARGRRRHSWIYRLGGCLVGLMVIVGGVLAAAPAPDAADSAPAPTATNSVEVGDRPLVVGLSPVPPLVIQSNNREGDSD